MPKTERGWSAEEEGLTTFLVDTAFKKKAPQGTTVRVRLNPPAKLLREDGQVFDLPAALELAESQVIAPLADLAKWTDTVTGHGRLTISFVTKRAPAVKNAVKKLDLQGYAIENVEVVARGSARLRRLYDLIDVYRLEKRSSDAKVVRALKTKKSPGSFAQKAGLDKRSLVPKQVHEALRWLDSELVRLGIEGLGVYVNAHPQQCRFDFFLGDGGLGRDAQEALAKHFDFVLHEARRIPGVLWTKNRLNAKGLERVEIVVDN